MIVLDQTWLRLHPLPQPEADTDKNKRGRVLAAGGAETVPAALLLTGEAAFRAGAGKVQLATVESVQLGLGLRMPEAASFGLPSNDYGELAAEAGVVLAGMLERCDALVLGPGMGSDAESGEILGSLFSGAGQHVPMLLDAAVIAAMANFVTQAQTWNEALVMTPHPGEMAALMGCDETQASARLAEAASDKFGATIVLKTSETWIATPGAATLHYPGGGPGLATGGSGDVLAGLIAGLMARGAEPMTAAGWGVWLHGCAGSMLAKRVGPLGFMASELLAEIPALMAAVSVPND
ncbi:NAD(P)H-hydrate dehydratase [Sphingomonas sp. AOB5]|uniref:NAD(P)H-hydrate dehydratase n=1 Tax=Sphingomonas sp. AOB5 TaxID=3034017 RepID=UPI0023F67147|nr:NAD(P)H-hydrate dehydratase [Sphingomonas sp. AOB5]MDF7773662.1 NAD(P)H-hydrate dehydratase [Sphingomonas sp. AOB5]